MKEAEREHGLARQRERYRANRLGELERARNKYNATKQRHHERAEAHRQRANSETLAKADRNHEKWSTLEDYELLYSGKPLKQIALNIGRTYNAVKSRRRDLMKTLNP